MSRGSLVHVAVLALLAGVARPLGAQPGEFRQLSDEQLLLCLNLPLHGDDVARWADDATMEKVVSGLRDVAGALQLGALPQATRALVHYFRGRDFVALPFSTGPLPRDGVDLRAARRMLDHEVILLGKTAYLGDPIQWLYPPRGMDRAWLAKLHELRHWLVLARAWRATGEGIYLAELDRQIQSWTAAFPAPQFRVDPKSMGGVAWDVETVAVRLGDVFPEVLLSTLNARELSDAARLALLKCIFLHCQYLMRYAPARGEQAVPPLAALAQCGVLFPEFAEARRWREHGLLGLALCLRDLYYPDGARKNLSLVRQARELESFARAARVACENNVALSQNFRAQLCAAAEYLARLCRPDFSLPGLSEAQTAAALSAVATVGEKLQREDLLYAGTRGLRGTAPPAGLWRAPYAGQCVMRSGWGASDVYLRFDCGPLGGAGMPEDALSFELYCGGQALVLDPQVLPAARASAAHNVVLLDGLGQRRGLLPEATWTRAQPLDLPLVDEPPLRLACGRYDAGFGADSPLAAAHLRKVAWVSPRLFVVADALLGEGEHRAQALFHLGPAPVKLDRERGLAWTARPGQANIALWCSQPKKWALALGEDRFGAVVRFEAAGRLPCSVEFVLHVFSGEAPPPLVVTRMAGSTAERLGLRIAHEEGAAELYLAHQPGARAKVGNVAFVPPAGLVLRDRGGKVLKSVRVLGM